MRTLRTISPVDGRVIAERQLATDDVIDAALTRAVAAQQDWSRRSVEARADVILRLVQAFVGKRDAIAAELTWQIGRPIRYAPGEIGGFEERARTMVTLAPDALADINVGQKDGFQRFIRRQALGTILVIAPWNYPYLTAVNAVVPALMAGNAVLLKHSHQTPFCSERLVDAGNEAGIPEGLFQFLHMSHDATARLAHHGAISHVCFTGSLSGGLAITTAAKERFIDIGLELGGKDPAYVRADANLDHAAENLVDGAFFNSGQSCCGIERIYVHANIFEQFVEKAQSIAKRYVLGDPTKQETTLGPMVRTAAADFVRGQTREAVAKGATPLLEEAAFERSQPGTPYLAPQILVNVDHSMRIMREESFGPVVGIMKVESDKEAVRLMNDSEFGLTAAIWTSDPEAAIFLGDQIDTGTVFMNRCDYLDPALAWTGVKNSGRGVTLSRLGYEYLTRPKSFHLRVKI
jgi:acyl-CoA reductase-like NAD-dependent aldehyde dehydrogenase